MFEFDELLDDLARITGRPPRRKIHVPVGLMMAQAAVLSHFPPPLKVTREQIEMLIEGTECDLTGMRAGPADRAGLAGRGLHEIGEIPPGD